ncbi:hypothetical protein ACFX1T_003896 [Malus domestica]
MDKAMNRQRVLQHLRPNSSVSSSSYESAALSSVSNCHFQAKQGGFKDTLPDALLAPVLKSTGNVHQALRQLLMCSPSVDLIFILNTGIAAGLESTTVDKLDRFRKINPKVDIFAQAHNCLLAVGITSENVAQRYGVTQKEQDRAAVESHRHAAAASASGKFKDEIVPIVYPNTGEERPVTISVDNGIRPNTNMNDSAKLKPAFKRDGSTTAGNASQVSDDAGAVLLMKRSLTMQKGLPILGVFGSFAAIGVDPAVMGVGPAAAIPVAVKSAGLELDDIDLFEINEAFASQYVCCCKKLELDPEKVNANGGAIALGHLGATGARCVATLLNEMKRRGRDHSFGVTSMCIGSGMEAAAVFERGDSVDELCNARTV